MKLLSKSLLRFAFILFILFLPACTAKPAQPASAPVVSQAQPTKTIDPNAGVVTGVMQLKGKPLKSVSLGLANVLKDAKGVEVATSYDRGNSPQVTTSEDGSFIFTNVKPGRYGLIYTNLPETYLLLYPGDPNVQKAILVTVDAGQKADLGVLNFSDLPDQGK